VAIAGVASELAAFRRGIDYQTYDAEGWTIAASETGTKFPNQHTGHGMFVSIEKVDTF